MNEAADRETGRGMVGGVGCSGGSGEGGRTVVEDAVSALGLGALKQQDSEVPSHKRGVT